MQLEQITCPADLRRLSSAELEQLGDEIRELIVDSVTANGGHLGSNLGVVELTIALHRVFDSPRDIMLWDTGHQAYVHKILTGRADGFRTLRKGDGMSGYPSRDESEHDWIENSHASTVLSYAYGLATAQDSDVGEGRRVIAVIGDGALTGGMAFEGLNNLGHSGRNVIIVLNDNGRSYAPTVSRLSGSLRQLRNNPRYLRIQGRLENRIKDSLPFSEHVERAMEATKAAVREMWDTTSFFEDLGVRYNGPFDGHDIEQLERAFRNAAEFEGPTVIHVMTEKGRGYAPAENDPVKRLHDMGPHAKPGSYTAAFTEALMKEAEARPEVVAITAAMPDSTGLLPFSERFPDRCIDVGIAEQHAVTAAAGMSMGGLRPVFAVYATFLTRAFDQVNLDVGLHGEPVVFCLDRAGITGDDGASHHGVLDMALLSKVPGMTVFAPSSYQELQQMLHDALEITSGPVDHPLPKDAGPQRRRGPRWAAVSRPARSPKASDVCLLAVGKMLAAATERRHPTRSRRGVDAPVCGMCAASVQPHRPGHGRRCRGATQAGGHHRRRYPPTAAVAQPSVACSPTGPELGPIGSRCMGVPLVVHPPRQRRSDPGPLWDSTPTASSRRSSPLAERPVRARPGRLRPLGLLLAALATTALVPTAVWAAPGDPGEPIKLNDELPAEGDVHRRDEGRGLAPQVSPDGDRVVFVERDVNRSRLKALWSAPIAGGPAVQLSPELTAQGEIRDVLITPDSQMVLYVADADTFGVRNLYAVPIEGGAPTRISPEITTPFRGAEAIHVTSDGLTAVFSFLDADDDRRLRAAPVSGGPGTEIGPGLIPTGELVLTADGTVVFTARVDSPGAQPVELWSAPVTGGPATRLNGELVNLGTVSTFDVSPDETTVVYRADQDTNNTKELYSVPAGGGTPIRLNDDLVNGGDVKPVFAISPDSTTVVYRADQDTNDTKELYVVPIGGGAVTRLNDDLPERGDVASFVIMPDSTRVVFRPIRTPTTPRSSTPSPSAVVPSRASTRRCPRSGTSIGTR